MSIRKWYTDEEVLDEEVILIIDITGVEILDLFIGVSNTFNSIVLKYNEHTRDIPLSVKVKDDFEHVVNNGILTVKIKRML